MKPRKLDPNNEVDRAYTDRIARVARVVFDYQTVRELRGACHELSAVTYMLLREVGVETADLCIGVAHSPYAPVYSGSTGTDFDHSWVEVEGAPVDVACAAPLEGMGFPSRLSSLECM